MDIAVCGIDAKQSKANAMFLPKDVGLQPSVLLGFVELAEPAALAHRHYLVAEVKLPREKAEELDQKLTDSFLVLASKFLCAIKCV